MCFKKTSKVQSVGGGKSPDFFFSKKQELEHCNEEIRDLEKKKEEIRRKFPSKFVKN